jgi:RND superfamily putative drug exporter
MITAAAVLITVVLLGFASGELLTIKQVGIALALAVVLDATVVRMLLVPATMKLLGRWNWWAPAPLARFQRRFGLREIPGAPDPAPAGTLVDQ